MDYQVLKDRWVHLDRRATKEIEVFQELMEILVNLESL
jgi:hypothetical protein